MPINKPSGLNKRHDTKSEKQERANAEAAMTPRTALTTQAPATLKGHIDASKTWKRVIGLYQETEAKIITAFDANLLVKYCLAEEELIKLQKIRNQIEKLWTDHSRKLNRIVPGPDNLKDYFNALNQANALLQRFQGMDARIDGKRKMLLAMEQSLYLTPRSRAGAVPPEKIKEQAKGEMENLLDE